ncbi:MAG: hypothetical protein GX589_02575 [Deltaproteobacteria bacterium]|nr:hypothetical protein [Deltaproteobacteria bacterium]
MSILDLSEFQTVSALSDRAMLWLLKTKPALFQLDPKRGFVLDSNNCDLQECIRAMASQEKDLLQEKRSLISERFGRIIRYHMDRILTEVIDRLKSSYSAK